MAAKKRQKPLTKPLIFISHDSRDAQIADALSDLITTVSLGMLESFRSSDSTGVQGIAVGDDWLATVKAKLRQATDVVCLITQRSFERPWILYEMGLAEGQGEKRISAISVGLKVKVSEAGPFAQFQAGTDHPDSLVNVVNVLLRHLPSAKVPKQILQDAIAKFLEAVAQRERSEIPSARKRHDVFVAAPMAALPDQTAYARQREETLELVEALRTSCKFESVFYAGREISSVADFEAADISVGDDFEALASSERFVLLFTHPVVTSALVEAGAAIGLKKPSLYLVRKRDDLPFLLRQAEQAFPFVRIQAQPTNRDFVRLIQKHGAKLFPDHGAHD